MKDLNLANETRIGLFLDHEKINFWHFKQIESLINSKTKRLLTVFILVSDKKFKRPSWSETLNKFLKEIIFFNADFIKGIDIDEQLRIFEKNSLKVELILSQEDLRSKIKSSEISHLLNLSSQKMDPSIHQNLNFLEYFFLFGGENYIFNLSEKIFLLKSEIQIQLICRHKNDLSVVKKGSVFKHSYSAAETINSCGMMTFDWMVSALDTKNCSVFLDKNFDHSKLNLFQSIFIFKLLFINRFRHFFVRLKRSITYQQWNIAYLDTSLEDLLNPLKSKNSLNPIQRQWIFDSDWPKSYADPFLLKIKKKLYLIFEDFNFKTFLGKISYIELGISKNKIKDHDPIAILEKKTHLSFPSVFEHNDKIFLIPEHISSKKVQAYELDSSDGSIKHEMTLLEGEHFVDPSLLYHNNKFWLFCGKWDAFSHGSSKLFIYYADSIEGPYLPHQQNPVVTDYAKARPAGSVINHKGELYRPSQNCLGIYGKELNIFKINKLTEEKYDEQLVNIVKPDAKYSLGCHHLTILDDKILVDGRRERISFKSFYFKLKYFLTKENFD